MEALGGLNNLPMVIELEMSKPRLKSRSGQRQSHCLNLKLNRSLTKYIGIRDLGNGEL